MSTCLKAWKQARLTAELAKRIDNFIMYGSAKYRTAYDVYVDFACTMVVKEFKKREGVK